MKKQISIAFFTGFCVAAILAAFFLARSHQQARNREAVAQALKQQVEYLGQTMVGLRKELNNLKEQQRVAAIPSTSKAIAPVPAPAVEPLRPFIEGQVPRGEPFEFNGRTYYLTPLAGTGGAAK